MDENQEIISKFGEKGDNLGEFGNEVSGISGTCFDKSNFWFVMHVITDSSYFNVWIF